MLEGDQMDTIIHEGKYFKVVVLKEKEWRRANTPDADSADACVHIVPTCAQATLVVHNDNQGGARDHISRTGLSLSLVCVLGLWVLCYRVPIFDLEKATVAAQELIPELDILVKQRITNGYTDYEKLINC